MKEKNLTIIKPIVLSLIILIYIWYPFNYGTDDSVLNLYEKIISVINNKINVKTGPSYELIGYTLAGYISKIVGSPILAIQLVMLTAFGMFWSGIIILLNAKDQIIGIYSTLSLILLLVLNQLAFKRPLVGDALIGEIRYTEILIQCFIINFGVVVYFLLNRKIIVSNKSYGLYLGGILIICGIVSKDYAGVINTLVITLVSLILGMYISKYYKLRKIKSINISYLTVVAALLVVYSTILPASAKMKIEGLIKYDKEIYDLNKIIKEKNNMEKIIISPYPWMPINISNLFDSSDNQKSELSYQRYQDPALIKKIITKGNLLPSVLKECVDQKNSKKLVVMDMSCAERYLIKLTKCSKTINFEKNGNLIEDAIDGISWSEADGRWTEQENAFFMCKLGENSFKELTIKMSPLIFNSIKYQRVKLSINGTKQQEFKLNESQEIKIKIPPLANQKYLILEIELPDSFVPANVGINIDKRKLGVRIQTIKFE